LSEPDGPWQRLSRRLFFRSPYYDFCHDRYRLPGGRTGDYYYIDIPGSSMIVPVLEGDDLVLVRQYRYLMGRMSLEFPAGGMKQDPDPLANARRELREETGFEAARWEKLGEFAPYNGASNELCHVFEAGGLVAAGSDPEPTEELEVVRVPLAQMEARIAGGEIWDGETIVAFHLFQSRRAAAG
jgi:ADP-ribose pyrophosphatase